MGRRRAITPALVAACVLAGVVLSVGIAWWQATRPRTLVVPASVSAPPSTVVVDAQRRIVGRFYNARPRSVQFAWTEGNGPWNQTKPVPVGIGVCYESELPGWVVRSPALGGPPFPGEQPPARGGYGTVTTTAYGWPRACMRMVTYTAEAPNSTAFRSHVRYAWVWGRNRWEAVPLLPVWTGLLFNAAAFAVPLLATVVGLRAGRRLLRIRRGSCAACGYDVAGLEQCPECGTPVTR
jgi:hypothetical protein